MDLNKEAMELHEQLKGKIEVISRADVSDRHALSVAYTPGVAAPCLAIKDNNDLSYSLTRRWNMVAVVTDGTAVLGLGDIGPEAGMPVMEGKCVLFKAFGDVDAFPICVRSKEVDDIVKTVSLISGSFGGINLEDISAPRCFEIEEKLKKSCDIPVFHDDQHGTAIIVLAGIINALRLIKKHLKSINVIINGPGAAGTAIAELLSAYGVEHIKMCDEYGMLYPGRDHMEWHKKELAEKFNGKGEKGDLKDAIKGADVFIGVSKGNLLTEEMVRSMNSDAVIFAMANPVPEIMPDLARMCGARVVGTGRSDYPNQVNNVLAFPGVFRGALDVRASDINEEMKLAAAEAIAGLIPECELNENNILPAAFDPRVKDAVAAAVATAARRSGAARI